MSRMFILYLCSLVLRSLILGGLAGVVLVKCRSVALRHAIWTIVLYLMLLMPLADAFLPTAMVNASIRGGILPVQTFLVIAPQHAVQPAALTHPAFPVQWIDGWKIAAGFVIVVAVALLARF